jgi:hypothetical protein
MNVLARILSHGFALALVALIAIALMYRGDLFPEWELPEFLVIEDKSSPGEGESSGDVDRSQPDAVASSLEPAVTESAAVEPVEETGSVEAADSSTVDAPPATSADIVAESDIAVHSPVAPETAVPDDDTGQDSAASDAVTVVTAEVPPASSTQAEAVSGEDSVTADAVAGSGPDEPSAESPLTEEAPEPREDEPVALSVVDTAEEAVPAASESSATDEPSLALESAQPSDSMPGPLGSEAPAAAMDGDGEKSAYELLAVAREAYWLRDYESAEKYYHQLIQIEPDNPDGYGELGNMYFAQGQWEHAAAAYYEAGVRMIEAGLVVQARQLVDVIRGLNGTQADELEQQVNAASQNTP